MDLQLTGKWVLITGASAGIGASAAKLFAREGVNLILTGRRAESLDALANEIIEAGGAPPPPI